jgi:hypothetical protein
MLTPEGRVKNAVKKILKRHAVYYEMHVPYGYGSPSLDFTGCCAGRFFAVETKAPGEKPTQRQQITIEKMMAAGAAVFVIDGSPDTLMVFEEWLQAQ